jgi:hypothetical protein
LNSVLGEILAAGMQAAMTQHNTNERTDVMGMIKKVAALGAVAAVGALAANRENVKKAVRGLIGGGKDAVHTVTEKVTAKVDDLATSADAALKPGIKKVARVAKAAGAKKPRAARRKARQAAHA